MYTTPTIPVSLYARLREDPDQFGVIFEYFRPMLRLHALRICGHTPFAQDVLQDTFISAYTHLHTLRDTSLVYPWLKKILENHCYMMLRKKPFHELSEQHFERNLQDSIDQHFEKAANRQRLYAALQLVSEELRACVMLRYFSSRASYDEIALTLAIPVGTVRSRLNAARKQMTDHFARIRDVGDQSIREANEWSDYFADAWNHMHHDQEVRNKLIDLFHPDMNIRFTSGAHGKGRFILERELDLDLKYGSSVVVKEVISAGNISVIEADQYNSPEHPDRCAPSSVFVSFRNGSKVVMANIFDSQRK